MITQRWQWNENVFKERMKDHPFFPRPSAGHEGVGNVGRVVDAQPDGYDDVGARDRVDCQAPEVDEPPNVDKGEHYTAEHKQARPDVEEEHPGGYEDAEDGQEDVPVELLRDHLVGLPGRVALAHGERLRGEVGFA